MMESAKCRRSDVSRQLRDTALALFADDKGILAMDESIAVCNARFAILAVSQVAEAGRDWRVLIVATPKLCEAIRGVEAITACRTPDERLQARQDNR